MFDCHVHTSFSTDSNMNIEAALKKAKSQNLGLIITEHMDLKYPDPEKFHFNIDEYLKTYEEYRGEKVLLGMEMGMRCDCIEENRVLPQGFNFDYIIGSVHMVNGIDIYEARYYENKSKQEAYEEYFMEMLNCIKQYDFVDSIGHIDYIARYARLEDKEIYYRDFAYIIDEILREVIKNGRILELNTRRLQTSKINENLLQIYKRYGELGGKYITLGSDSHNCDDIGRNFNMGKSIAEICGLNIVHFKERKMILSK